VISPISINSMHSEWGCLDLYITEDNRLHTLFQDIWCSI